MQEMSVNYASMAAGFTNVFSGYIEYRSWYEVKFTVIC